MTYSRAVFPFSIDRQTDTDDRTIVVAASTATVGRDNLTIPSTAFRLDNYRLNPIVLWQHNADWPVARADEIGVVGGKLVSKVRFPPAGVSARADEVLGLIRAGVINAASTGFDTIEGNQVDGGPVMRITDCELQEFSFVSVPAVPDALVLQRATADADIERVLRRVIDARESAFAESFAAAEVAKLAAAADAKLARERVYRRRLATLLEIEQRAELTE